MFEDQVVLVLYDFTLVKFPLTSADVDTGGMCNEALEVAFLGKVVVTHSFEELSNLSYLRSWLRPLGLVEVEI